MLIASGLSLEDALLGQFELACCDSVSAFLRDEVAREADARYLDGVYSSVLHSPEFEEVRVEVVAIPGTDEGSRFVDQFLGPSASRVPLSDGEPRLVLNPTRKKARIMAYWAEKVGARVVCH